MFCSNCGSKLPEGARFCSTCGARVADMFEVPAAPEKPASAVTAENPAEKSYEAPLKKRVTFDWSNVIDEPQKRDLTDIKSPWETSEKIDEKDLTDGCHSDGNPRCGGTACCNRHGASHRTERGGGAGHPCK